MRIPSGKTDQLIYFVAVDATDLKTRETGLSSFTVYRSRNGGAATIYTTPTVAELSAANMPGVYSLAIDEDTTIGASSDSEEYCVHITQAAMAPVTRTIELYRRDTTTGRTLDVSAGGEAGLDWANVGTPGSTVSLSATTISTLTTYTGNTPQTGDAFARLGAPAGVSVSADILVIDNLVDDLESRVGTPSNLGSGATVAANLVDIEGQTDDIGVAGAGLTNIGTIATVTTLTNLPAITANWLTAAGIQADAITAAKVAADVTTEIWAGSTAPSAATIAAAVWDLDATTHQTQGTFGQAIGDPVADTNTIYKAVVSDATGATVGVDVVAIKAETVNILTDTAEIGAAGAGLTNINLPNQTMDIVGNITGNLSGSVGSVTGSVGSVVGMSAANIATGLTEVTAIKAKTDSLTFTVAGMADANIQAVNDITVTGNGQPGTEWGP